MESRKGRYYFGDNRPDSDEQGHWLFVKRPGLRPEEVSSGTLDQLKGWKWWLTIDELAKEVDLPAAESKEAVTALLLGPPPEILDVEMVVRNFCVCHEAGIYPPDWIIEELYRRFTKWLKANLQGEQRSLDVFFKLPGNDNPAFFERVNESEFWWNACDKIQCLRHYFKVSYGDAIAIVEDTIQKNPSFALGDNALEQRYKAWKRGREFKVWQTRHQEQKTPEQLKKFLSVFPREAFSPYLKKKRNQHLKSLLED